MTELGKYFLLGGAVMIVLGIGLLVVGSLSGKATWLGRLPGDVLIQHGRWTFYAPLGTSLLISVVLSVLFWLLARR